MDKEPEAKQDIIQARRDLPTIYSEHMHVLARGDKKFLMHFCQDVGGIKIEQARVLLEDESGKLLIDILSKHLNYYPKKPRVNKK